jgi:hypothetical protein
VYTTRFPHEAKSMQLKRQMVFKRFDVGRIHEQTVEYDLCVFAGESVAMKPVGCDLLRWRGEMNSE